MRAATRMLILIVSCYLGANILNVIITVWEVGDRYQRRAPLNIFAGS